MKRTYRKFLTASLAFVFAASMFTGCSTVPTGGSGTEQVPNWALINEASRTSLKWATKLVLDKNPGYAEQVAAVNLGIATIFAGELTEEGVRSQVSALAPKLSEQDAATIASAVMDAYRTYVAAGGSAVLVQTDEHVAALVAAITKGIAEGVALHNAGK